MIVPRPTKWDKARLVLFSTLILPALSAVSHAQVFQPEAHPNHYVILVDASGSAIESRAKRAAYTTALTGNLPLLLYKSGFGDRIPPISPENDYLTVLQFGIVPSGSAPAYTRLKEYDLINDFIHKVTFRSANVGQKEFQSSVIPEHYYGLTVLSWARQIALSTLAARHSNAGSNRTFLIIISDGIANGGVPAAEISTVETFANRTSVDRVKALVNEINRDYQFTNGMGQEGWAFQDKIPDSDRPLFFIEAYEVVSVAQAKWETDAKGLRPLDRLEIEWTNESGVAPEGILIARSEKAFLNRLGVTTDSTGTLNTVPDGTDGAASWRLGSSLRKPFSVQGELSCESRSIDVFLRIPITQTDERLGLRTINYAYQQSVFAPPPLRCTAVFAFQMGLAVLLIVLALAASAYYLYYRRWATHMYVEVPGALQSIGLHRKRSQGGWVHMTPQHGLEALSVILPSRLKQLLLYRGATITLVNQENEESLRWLDVEGDEELKLPFVQGSIPAYWRRPPQAPSTITVSFCQRHQHANLSLRYPPALPGSFTRSVIMSERKIKAYVALDLGSESMAAYFEDLQGNGGMIELQRHAELLLGQSGTSVAQKPDLLMENSGKDPTRSPRLWNRISFNIDGQPKNLDENHAKLRFVMPTSKGSPGKDTVLLAEYYKSLFRFFHLNEEWPHPTGVLPNPKILFQQQVTKILSKFQVAGTDGNRFELSPEMLIKHLTVQVLTNFVLSSPELREFDQSEIHLTVTCPNVYSLPHSQSIKQFVRDCFPALADVQVLSESDAVGYYALRTVNQRTDSPELKAFKRAWTKELEQAGRFCLVTIDVGKGTSDLSCILVQDPPKPRSAVTRLAYRMVGRKATGGDAEKRRRHSVQGKTGKSSGGNYLNYILASYYEERLRDVARGNPFPEGQSIPPRFITQEAGNKFVQSRALSALENLIERVKRSMNEDFEIVDDSLSEAVQTSMLEEVVDRILTTVNQDWANSAEEDKKLYDRFKEEALKALSLPTLIETGSKPSVGERILQKIFWFNRPRRSNSVYSTPQGAHLKDNLKRYVADNVDELLDSLQGLVRAHHVVSDDRASIDGGAFFVISGQGSQFEPLRAAIMLRCKDLGVDDDHVLFVRGVESKEACCKGVVNFWRDNMLVVNERELHGTYGCMDLFTGTFRPFDMKRVNHESSDRILLDIESTYLIIFTPRSAEEVEVQPPELSDGATALLSVFPRESTFTIKYDRSALRLTVNDLELAIGSFGDVDSSIYEKVWPEILQPKKEVS